MEKSIKNIEKFNLDSVKDWKRADFIAAFNDSYPNAEEIYNFVHGKPLKKKAEKSNDTEKK